MTIDQALEAAMHALGTFGGSYLGLRLILNGIRANVNDIKATTDDTKTVVTKMAETVEHLPAEVALEMQRLR